MPRGNSRLADGDIGQTTLPEIDEESIPKGERGVAKDTMERGIASLKITVRGDESPKPTRMVKPPSAVPNDKWVVTKVFKEPPSKLTPLKVHTVLHD